MSDIKPTFQNTWRFAFAIYWKLLAFCLLALAVLHFASYVLPFGQVAFWGANLAYRVSSALEIEWLTPEWLWLGWAFITTVGSLVAQFLVFNLLVAMHMGKRFKTVEFVMREAV